MVRRRLDHYLVTVLSLMTLGAVSWVYNAEIFAVVICTTLIAFNIVYLMTDLLDSNTVEITSPEALAAKVVFVACLKSMRLANKLGTPMSRDELLNDAAVRFVKLAPKHCIPSDADEAMRLVTSAYDSIG